LVKVRELFPEAMVHFARAELYGSWLQEQQQYLCCQIKNTNLQINKVQKGAGCQKSIRSSMLANHFTNKTK